MKGGTRGGCTRYAHYFSFFFYSTDFNSTQQHTAAKHGDNVHGSAGPTKASPTHVWQHPSPSKSSPHVPNNTNMLTKVCLYCSAHPLSSTLCQTAKAHSCGHTFGVWHIPPPFTTPHFPSPSTTPDTKNVTLGLHSLHLGCPSHSPSSSTIQTQRTQPQGHVLHVWGVSHTFLYPL